MTNANTLYVVLPCYKEEEVLPETAKRIQAKLLSLMEAGTISEASKVLFVNDGSPDHTWGIIEALHQADPIFCGVNLSKNKGHQNALLAGLVVAKDRADMVISMDADLQDDINAIDEMVAKYQAGNDVVYGVRSSRASDTWFKRVSAESFYKLMRLMGVDIVFNHADYRLMSKRAIESLELFKEAQMFIRGIVPMIGYKSATVYYERSERFAGETKYPLKKMLTFALEGTTSLSIKPIRLITVTGFLFFIVSVFMLGYFMVDYLRGGTQPGWASLIVSIWGIGGLQLLAIGIIGEYIGKIYATVKGRPRYIIEQVLMTPTDQEGSADDSGMGI